MSAQTITYTDLSPRQTDTFEQWLEENNLTTGAYIIEGAVENEYLVELPENFTPTAELNLPYPDSALPVEEYTYLILGYGCAGEGLIGQRFTYSLTLTNDPTPAWVFIDRWKAQLED